MGPFSIILFILIFFLCVALFKCVRIVPQKQAFIVERLGKYHNTLEAGLHILVPFIDKVSYRHTLKEQAVDVAPQACITKDNIAHFFKTAIFDHIFNDLTLFISNVGSIAGLQGKSYSPRIFH